MGFSGLLSTQNPININNNAQPYNHPQKTKLKPELEKNETTKIKGTDKIPAAILSNQFHFWVLKNNGNVNIVYPAHAIGEISNEMIIPNELL